MVLPNTGVYVLFIICFNPKMFLFRNLKLQKKNTKNSREMFSQYVRVWIILSQRVSYIFK